ncbi:MAG TPA: hypothetical protein VK896_09915, partial [Gaiellaceae bacterium]|nr:hypothetical protein [Gaiellaceae bacterium]
ARDAAVNRLSADVIAAAEGLRRWCGPARPARVGKDDRARLVTALSEVAGVPHVVAAVGAAHRRRGALAGGWPPVRWLGRLKPDPLRRLRLGDAGAVGRTSVPPATDVQRAQAATAVRLVADDASAGLPAPWPTLVRRAATASDEVIVDRLDQAVGSAEIHTGSPWWWGVASFVQWVLLTAAVAGAAWIGLAGVAGYLRIEDVVPLPELAGAPVATWLVLGGLVAGFLLSFLARLLNGAGARRRQRAAERALRPRVEAVADELVIGPVERELAAHETLCGALDDAVRT